MRWHLSLLKDRPINLQAFRSWNLNLLELLYYILSSHSPAAIFGLDPEKTKSSSKAQDAAGDTDAGTATTPSGRGDGNSRSGVDASTTAASRRNARPGELATLLQLRQEERRRQQMSLDSRHGNFGGTFRVRSQFGDTENIVGRQGYACGGLLPVSNGLAHAPRASGSTDHCVARATGNLL